jgi:hypothetical protein
MDDVRVIFPAQCSCGHLFLERFMLGEPNEKGEVGFCWCGFCQTKRFVKPYKEQTLTKQEKLSTQKTVNDILTNKRLLEPAPQQPKP